MSKNRSMKYWDNHRNRTNHLPREFKEYLAEVHRQRLIYKDKDNDGK